MSKQYHLPNGEPCIKCGYSIHVHYVDHNPDGDPCEHCGLAAKNHRDRTGQQRKDNRVDHQPNGDPCIICGKPNLWHRVKTNPEHESNGDPCSLCGLAADKHRIRNEREEKRIEHEPKGDPCTECGVTAELHRHRSDKARIRYIGIDGEGQGRSNHKYVLLAASTEKGERIWTTESDRLSTEDCLDLILGLPTRHTKIFSYSFNYDLTKMLMDLDNESLYKLFRPELRQRRGPDAAKGPYPVEWGKYKLNLQGTKFTVRRKDKKVVIWDLFKFFQAKFVGALKDWKVGTKELWDRMSLMKDKRSEFDKESKKAVRNYCLEECRCIAELGHKLIDAHETAGLNLRTFYGAGSSGAAMLSAMGIREKIRSAPDEMRIPVASAFAGGRFENSIIGQVEEVIYNRDLSSAYPYHITFLPCLMHGQWRLTRSRNEIEESRAALVHYGLGSNCRINSWGPFPFRTSDGSISFPIHSGGGWVWKDEYLSGERVFPHVQFKEAWIYECDCDCQPFKKIPEYYILRLHLGKEGPGIVIKLGCNSCYGKLAQSVGNALFNSWIWAGMITSGCRAQVLDFLGQHQDWNNLLAIATDGVYTREKIIANEPRDTGTADTGKPLGGWENKEYNKGMFFARPGIYFPLNPTAEDIKDIRGRGVGKGVVLENWKLIIDAWEKEGIKGCARVANVTRFCGAKTCISKTQDGIYNRASHKGGIRPAYGQWITRKVEMSFHPMPKREEVNRDGMTLKLRSFPKFLESMPYDRAMISREAIEMMLAETEALEQPDGDLTEYE